MSHTEETLFTDKYLQIYDPARKSIELRRKSQAEGNLSLLETMELIDALLRRYQTSYKVTGDPKTLWMPFLFKEPQKGDKVLNENTGETYTVRSLVKNPKTNKWEGLVRFDLVHTPNDELRHRLKFYDIENYVRFDHNFMSDSPNALSTNSDGGGVSAPPMKPTIAWVLIRKEPGAHGQAFGPRKEYKARQREQLKDPLVRGHSVIVSGQSFDNIVQFDALYSDNRSAEMLVEWFEQFMRLYRHVFRENGVEQMFFWKRLEDDTTREFRQPLWKRSIQYYIRTEQLEATYTRDLLRIDTSVDVLTKGSHFTGAGANLGFRYIADQLVSGELTVSGYRRLFYDQSGKYLFGDIDLLQ